MLRLEPILLFSQMAAKAEDWPQFRGVNRDAIWNESGLLHSFPADALKICWRQPVGRGLSSPAVVSGRVFLTVLRRVRDHCALNAPNFFSDSKLAEEEAHAEKWMGFDAPEWRTQVLPVVPAVTGSRTGCQPEMGVIDNWIASRGGTDPCAGLGFQDETDPRAGFGFWNHAHGAPLRASSLTIGVKNSAKPGGAFAEIMIGRRSASDNWHLPGALAVCRSASGRNVFFG